jgi:hypothetical protein
VVLARQHRRVLLADGDALAIFLPMRRMFAEQVAAGVLPLWNPRVFGGMPFFGAMQTSMLYPPTWLFLLLPPLAAMNLLVIGHFAGAALAAYGYGRTIGCRPAAAGFSGLVFAFGGFMFTHMGNIPLFQDCRGFRCCSSRSSACAIGCGCATRCSARPRLRSACSPAIRRFRCTP